MANQRHVLITGCSDGGIGCALAHAFHERGFHVFATARNTDKMVSLADKPNITILKLDVVNDEQVALALKRVDIQTGGKLDILINNAARNHFMPLVDEDIQNVQKLFDSNVIGPLRMMKAFAPLIIGTKGTIVNVTSVSGYLNMPWMGSYGATKRSLQIMSETLRLELQPFGVRVLSLVTGPTWTNGLTYFDDFALPPSSFFKSIERIIYARAHGRGNAKTKPTADEFAAKVVPTILSGHNGLVWGPGYVVTLVKFAVNWLSTSMTDCMWRNDTGLEELTANINAKKD